MGHKTHGAVPQKSMMIKVDVLFKAVSKVANAVGKDDLIELAFAVQKGTPMCMFTAYDGKGLQMQQILTYEGEAEPQGKHVVKASTLINTLKLYSELGVKEISLKADDKNLTLTDDNGATSFPLAPSMTQLAQSTISAGVKGKIVIATKPLATAVKTVAYAAGTSTGNAKLNGVFFEADSEGKAVTIYTSDGFRGAKIKVDCDIQPAGEVKAADMSFFAMPQILKVAGCLVGETLTMIVAKNYICLKDSENTIISVALSGEAFPIGMLNKIYTEKGTISAQSGDQPVKAIVTVSADAITSAVELAALVSTEEIKTVKFDFERQGEDKPIFKVAENAGKAARKIDAEVALADGDIPTIKAQASFFKDGINTLSGDKATIKFAGPAITFYEEKEDAPKAFLMMRNK